jgi:hypothetical protein
MVRVFTYQAPADGRLPEAIAEDAFALANGHPRDPGSAALSRQYYERRLRSVQFPGKLPCCPRSCCICRGVVLPGRVEGDQADPGGVGALMAGLAGDEVRQ